jgi:phosphoribosylglycinamide formyltransferase-1
MGETVSPIRIAIFASGKGSNAQKIIDYFSSPSRSGAGKQEIKVTLIICNKPDAGVLGIAAKEKIPFLVIDKEKFFRGNAYADELKEKKIDYIVLAGFLWKIPPALVKAYTDRIINIHPALLPKYGGKGMYGSRVHEAVIAAGEKESGISIHYVDEVYDHGRIIFQAKVAVTEDDTPGSLAEKIHLLEHTHFPRVIGEWITAKYS